jgi:hypothetical protein
VTHTGCLLTTIDAEIGKIGPGPRGCGVNWARPHCRPRLWTRHSPSDSASSGPIFARNAIHPSSVNRP